jgi:hypothetical protein
VSDLSSRLIDVHGPALAALVLRPKNPHGHTSGELEIDVNVLLADGLDILAAASLLQQAAQEVLQRAVTDSITGAPGD